jgi:hypothetical protein
MIPVTALDPATMELLSLFRGDTVICLQFRRSDYSFSHEKSQWNEDEFVAFLNLPQEQWNLDNPQLHLSFYHFQVLPIRSFRFFTQESYGRAMDMAQLRRTRGDFRRNRTSIQTIIDSDAFVLLSI